MTSHPFRIVALMFFALVAANSLISVSVASSQTPARDLKSIGLLTQCVSSLGDPVTILGLRVTGTLQKANDTNGELPFTFEARDWMTSRMTIQTSAGNEIHVVSGGHGSTTLANGTHRAKSDASVRYPWPEFVPSAICSAPLLAANFSISYVESVSVNSTTTDHLRFSAVVQRSDGTPDAEEALISGLDLYLDATTHLPLRTTTRAFGSGIQNSIPIDTYYSGYSTSTGIMYPSTITETANGKPNRTITVQSTSTNVALPASDFTLGGTQ